MLDPKNESLGHDTLGQVPSLSNQHLLLTLARTYRRFTGDLSPEGYHYDLIVGAWLSDSDGRLLVETTERPGPMTKKEDIETGEDQKSE